MAGDRERCLEAGMNDHVAKPIDVAALFDVLGRWIHVPEYRLNQATDSAEGVWEQASELPEIPGLDYDSGLARCGGNIGLYRKILRKFCETQAAAPGRIRAALDAGDLVAAEREAHTLKGVAGNIGADAVQATAKTVETQIKQEKDTDTGLAALEPPLRELIESLSHILVSSELACRCDMPSHAPELRARLDRLQALLKDNDAEAGDLAEQIASQLADEETRRRIQPICALIEDFEFEDAVELLVKFRAALE
jgi:HPt (histidine-containing phosphotransfer) domain-containing protein